MSKRTKTSRPVDMTAEYETYAAYAGKPLAPTMNPALAAWRAGIMAGVTVRPLRAHPELEAETLKRL